MDAHNEQTAKQQFYTSLERTGAGYFDYYLLHALQAGNYKTYDKYHIWDFVKEQKEKGLIRTLPLLPGRSVTPLLWTGSLRCCPA